MQLARRAIHALKHRPQSLTADPRCARSRHVSTLEQVPVHRAGNGAVAHCAEDSGCSGEILGWPGVAAGARVGTGKRAKALPTQEHTNTRRSPRSTQSGYTNARQPSFPCTPTPPSPNPPRPHPHVAQVTGRLLRQGHLLVVVDHPAPLLQQQQQGQRGASHVARRGGAVDGAVAACQTSQPCQGGVHAAAPAFYF